MGELTALRVLGGGALAIWVVSLQYVAAGLQYLLPSFSSAIVAIVLFRASIAESTPTVAGSASFTTRE